MGLHRLRSQARPRLRWHREREHLVPRSTQPRWRRQSLPRLHPCLSPGDGELVWHYQVTPQENWDYDATQPLMLADINIAGTPRKVIMQASKNGFFYVLDRETGQFISAKPFVDGVSWATGIDPQSGRPIESAAAYDGLNPVFVSPAPGGAHNWYPMAFNPTTGIVYLPARQGSVRAACSR